MVLIEFLDGRRQTKNGSCVVIKTDHEAVPKFVTIEGGARASASKVKSIRPEPEDGSFTLWIERAGTQALISPPRPFGQVYLDHQRRQIVGLHDGQDYLLHSWGDA